MDTCSLAHEPRIARLEWLTKRLAASAAPGFAGPIVPNEAAAAALPGLPDGREVFVLSHRSIWTKRVGVAGVQGVPPLAAHEVIACTDGTGVLTRTTYSDPALRIGVNFIHIDPANILANDENDGLTAGAPLQTGRELFRRWGWGSAVEVGPNQATSVDGFLEIRVHSDLVTPDSLPARAIAQSNSSIRIRGGVKTVIHQGTFTAAPTQMNPAVAVGGTRLRLTDAALANWTPFIARNRRGQITVAAAGIVGATFQPQFDVPAGPGQVDCSAAQTTDEYPGLSLIPTTVLPANGNTYQIQELITVNIDGLFEWDQELNPTFGGFNVLVNIVDCHLPSVGAQRQVGVQALNGVWINFYQCTFSRAITLDQAGAANLIACYFTEGPINNGGDASLVGGGAVALAATTQKAIGWVNSLLGVVDVDFVSHAMPIFLDGTTSCQNAAVWQAAVLPGVNPGGHGFLVGGGRTRADVTFQALAWGAGNAGVGIRVGAGCDANGAPQNATGGTGDLALASQVGAGATCVYWNVATSTYLPVGGQGLSWALLTAGYGLSAHWPDQNSHWNALEVN